MWWVGSEFAHTAAFRLAVTTASRAVSTTSPKSPSLADISEVDLKALSYFKKEKTQWNKMN
jgi:hypothetical protein